jgi:hypothetical protein
MANKTKKVLQSALKAFGPHGENWVQGTAKSMQWPNCCVNTSFMRIEVIPNGTYIEDAVRVLFRVGEFEGGGASAQWNDAPERTWPEVKELFEKAIAAA